MENGGMSYIEWLKDIWEFTGKDMRFFFKWTFGVFGFLIFVLLYPFGMFMDKLHSFIIWLVFKQEK